MKVCCPLSHFHPPRSNFRVARVARAFVCDCGVNFLGYDQPCELKIFNPAATVESGEAAGIVETLPRGLIGPKPIEQFKGDGCTMAPDELNGVDISEACRFHDWAYYLGGSERQRLEADRNLLINIVILGGSHIGAAIYFRRVRFWGVPHFAYRKRRPGWSFRLWLLAARYWQ